mgnify:FL=1
MGCILKRIFFVLFCFATLNRISFLMFFLFGLLDQWEIGASHLCVCVWVDWFSNDEKFLIDSIIRSIYSSGLIFLGQFLCWFIFKLINENVAIKSFIIYMVEIFFLFCFSLDAMFYGFTKQKKIMSHKWDVFCYNYHIQNLWEKKKELEYSRIK